MCLRNVAFVGASILSLASAGGSALGLASHVACVVISVKTNFSDHVKITFISQLDNGKKLDGHISDKDYLMCKKFGMNLP